MYDVRCTMYDLNYSAPEAREFGNPSGKRIEKGVCLCTMYNTHDDPRQLRSSCLCTMLDVRCWMYDVRLRSSRALRGGRWRRGRRLCTTEADGVCLCTTYDVRCTIWIIARQRRGNCTGAAADPEQPESGHSGGLFSDGAGGTCCHHQRGVFLGVRVIDPMDTLGGPDRIVSGSTDGTNANPTFSTTLLN